MPKAIISAIFLFRIFTVVFSQGNLVLTGGGVEVPGGWSDKPFSWAVERAENKKVAIISKEYQSETLSDYFYSLGANRVKDFRISFPAVANIPSTVDSLINYDLWYFVANSPGELYHVYKDTRLARGIDFKFQKGGVIMGNAGASAALGDIIFTGDHGLIESQESLENIGDKRIQLAADFLNLTEGYLVDTHFSERGRFGRLLAFMSRWSIDREEQIAGLGIDEYTAFCIDQNSWGTVMGNGSVTVFLDDMSSRGFYHHNGQPAIDSLAMIQLIEGNQYNLVSWETAGFGQSSQSGLKQETGDYTLLLSGSKDLSANEVFFDSLIHHNGVADDEILIITGPSVAFAEVVKAMLLSQGAGPVSLLPVLAGLQDNQGLNERIQKARKFLFVNNDLSLLMEFLESGVNGALLSSRLKEPGGILAFLGEDCRLAGKAVISNQQVRSASFTEETSELFIYPGLGLLGTTVVIPNPNIEQNFFGNITTGLPYMMVKENLTRGLWIPDKGFVKYYPDNGKVFIISLGFTPSILVKNQDSQIHLPDPETGFNRNSVGFSGMKLSVLDTTPTRMGTISHQEIPVITTGDGWISVYPNPIRDNMNILLLGSRSGTFTFQLVNHEGKEILAQTYSISPDTQSLQIPVPNLNPGMYMLLVREAGYRVVERIQVIR